jgi:putative membrane protein
MQRVQLFMRAAGLAAAVTVASAGLHAQTPAGQSGVNKGSQGATKGTGNTATVSSDDTMFAQRAAEAGMKEVQQGKMAASKASNAQVKSFGSMLVKDHQTANQQLMAIAKKKNIDLPNAPGSHGSIGSKNDATADTKTGGARPAAGANPTGTTGASGGVDTTGHARDQMMGRNEPWMTQTGAAFDRGFVEAQVKAHQEAITLFEKESSNGSDSDLKAFATKQLPALRAHLKQAQDLQTKLGASTH